MENFEHATNGRKVQRIRSRTECEDSCVCSKTSDEQGRGEARYGCVYVVFKCNPSLTAIIECYEILKNTGTCIMTRKQQNLVVHEPKKRVDLTTYVVVFEREFCSLNYFEHHCMTHEFENFKRAFSLFLRENVDHIP